MIAFRPVLDTPSTIYTIQKNCNFLDSGYYASEGSVHPAVDYNAKTGGDTDLGDGIHAADVGTVCGIFRDGYIGGIVEILHLDGSISGYWHCRNIHVILGQIVKGGDLIGQFGKGGTGKMWAHLHFYVKKPGVKLPLTFWPSLAYPVRSEAETFTFEHYENPEQWLAKRQARTTLFDLQNVKGHPATKVVINGVNVTGQLIRRPQNGTTIDARTSNVRIYANEKAV